MFVLHLVFHCNFSKVVFLNCIYEFINHLALLNLCAFFVVDICTFCSAFGVFRYSAIMYMFLGVKEDFRPDNNANNYTFMLNKESIY